jgi:hypothetical protein
MLTPSAGRALNATRDQDAPARQSAITLTYAVMTGHRACHDGGVSRVILSAGWDQMKK